jgi:DNA-binding MarR family transcriptional regulator
VIPTRKRRPGVDAAAPRRRADPGAPEIDPMAPIVARAEYMMGENVARGWSPERAGAWEGFLELAGRLRQGAEKELEAYGDLSVSTIGVMGRLVIAERMTLRQTALADAMGLSLSRVSRIIDILEGRRLVERTPCPVDGRATNVTLTAAGLRMTRSAQEALSAFVEGAFFDRLSEEEIGMLADVFGRLICGDPAADGAGPD